DADGLTDGVEIGLTAPQGVNTNMAVFQADADPATHTNPADDDTDDDGLKDGWEDANHNGRVDAGELDPRSADSDQDGLPDGLELGLTAPQGVNTNMALFKPDGDPATT